MEFLRELAHVSDQPLSAFDMEFASVGKDVAPEVSFSRRFQVRRCLGAGGFGTVYEAFDCEQRATVALKVLRRRDGRSITGFKSEFRSLVETVHENLVQLYELHAEGGEWFFTMELVRGTNALAYVRPFGGPCDEQRLRSVFRQLARGLSFLHGAGKLHRDVKPSNVMVTDEGRVVIVDFGLAGDITELKRAEGVFGTPAYMAPEQAEGRSVGPAADWYAVGMMLYEALTGRLPLRDRNFTPPGRMAQNIPEDLDRLCVELLVPTPEQRPTAQQVQERLEVEQPGKKTGPGTAWQTEWSGRASDGEAQFIGREAYLAQLHDALATTEQGGSVVVLLHGRSGMGKSALLQRFLGEVRARDPGRPVLFGRCFEQESVPYKGVDGIIDELCQILRHRPSAELAAKLPSDFPMLARLFPQLGELARVRSQAPVEVTDDPILRPRAFAALRELLGQAAPNAAVLVVDDLQWADLDSTALLTALLHGPREQPLLLITTYRTEDVESNPVILSFLGEFATASKSDPVDVRKMEVGALDEMEAEALSRSLLSADQRGGELLTEEAVVALVAEARGDPFLLTELLRPDSGAGRLALGTLLGTRIGGLGEAARRLLEVVALGGQPIPRAVAARAAYGSEGESDALGSISVLRAERLIRSRRTDAGDEILPYHDRIREMVIQRIDPDTRRGHHHRLALALHALSAVEPEQLLFHYRSAGRLGDAARYAPDAARRAHKALAFDRAARLYREALALGALRTDSNGSSRPQTPAEDHALRVALAEALAGAGRPREAALAFLEAARGVDLAQAQVFRGRAAELLIGAGYEDEGFATLRDVLRDVGVKLSTFFPRSLLGFAALRLRLFIRGLGFREQPESAVGKQELLRVDACYAAALGLFLTNPILAAESQARHLLLALEAGEPVRVARALGFEAVFSTVRRGADPWTAHLLATARAIEQRFSHPQLTGLMRICEGQVAQSSGQWRRAHALMLEGESVLLRSSAGVSLERDFACSRRTDILWNLGEIAELSRLVPALVEEARERGNRYLALLVQLSTGAILGLVEGRPDRARETVAAALKQWPRASGSMLHARELRAQARIALYEGRGHVTLSWIEGGLSALRRTGFIFVRGQMAEFSMLGGLAALSIGDAAGAARHARAITRLGFPWAENMARILSAGLRRRAGDSRGALAILGRARQTAREMGAALYEAAMSRRQGEWLGNASGRAQIEAADAWMAGQGIVEPERMTAMLLGWT